MKYFFDSTFRKKYSPKKDLLLLDAESKYKIFQKKGLISSCIKQNKKKLGL
jgi:hypothetical protein